MGHTGYKGIFLLLAIDAKISIIVMFYTSKQHEKVNINVHFFNGLYLITITAFCNNNNKRLL